MELLWEGVILGRPITKKNSQQIIVNKRTGRPLIIQSPQYRQYLKDALKQLRRPGGPIDIPVLVSAVYWMPNKRSRPDISGLTQATGDILEDAQVIKNDQLIMSWISTWIDGIDRDNPRVEIRIFESKHNPWE